MYFPFGAGRSHRASFPKKSREAARQKRWMASNAASLPKEHCKSGKVLDLVFFKIVSHSGISSILFAALSKSLFE